MSALYIIFVSFDIIKAIFPTLHLEDLRFHNYLRMPATQLENLLQLIGADIHKEFVVREPIAAAELLILPLRFLAAGDSIHSMSYQHLVGATTASNIMYEVCRAIWKNLQPIVLPAIDGKHIVMQCPSNAGSTWYNYKGNHSLVLLGVGTADYVCTFADIGAYSRRSDGGIFKDSLFGRCLENGSFEIPQPSPVSEEGRVLPYCIAVDEAFSLKENLMQPYPGKSVTSQERRVFNYRPSRARLTSEYFFGIMANKFRNFRKSIIVKPAHVIEITQAIVCLHNMLRLQDIANTTKGETNMTYVFPEMVVRETEEGFIPETWRNEHATGSALQEITRTGNNAGTREAFATREQFCEYFNNEGTLGWQYQLCKYL